MRTSFDFSPYRQAAIGLDNLFDVLERGPSFEPAASYPPFNIEQDDQDHYRITLAVAGFKPGDIAVTAQQNLLVVSGRTAEAQTGGQFLFRGIAAQPFERHFILGDFVKVREAGLKDGLLTIELVREIPEEMKPRKIQIGGAETANIEGSVSGSPTEETSTA